MLHYAVSFSPKDTVENVTYHLDSNTANGKSNVKKGILLLNTLLCRREYLILLSYCTVYCVPQQLYTPKYYVLGEN
jgi:hypothetical protein